MQPPGQAAHQRAHQKTLRPNVGIERQPTIQHGIVERFVIEDRVRMQLVQPFRQGVDDLLETTRWQPKVQDLDQHAFPPEPRGMWVSGSGRADVLVRSIGPVDHLSVEADSPIRTTLTISMGREAVVVPIEPNKTATFDLPAAGARGLRSYAYLLQARSSEGFVPHLTDPMSQDRRYLGVQVRFHAVAKTSF